MTQQTTQAPARLITAGPHPHALAGDCPVGCLSGLVTNHTFRAVRYAMQCIWPRRPDDRLVISDLAVIVRDGRLAQERGIGRFKVAETEQVLCAAGLISEGECEATSALAARAHWLPANGSLIRQLRTERDWSQVELASFAGVSVSAVAAIEASDHVYCKASTLEHIAVVLEYLPASLTWQASAQVTKASEAE
jgi:DNA-binding XRE family transcriptional regulator